MQKNVLDILTKADGFISGQEISEALGVSRQAVWKAVNSLKSEGYKIESVTSKGYRLASYPLHLNEKRLKSLIKNKIIGKNLIVLDSVGSTNDYLKRLGNDGCENGTVVAAREQTNGKGRLGRQWQTKKDNGIAFSVLLRPQASPSEISSVTPLTGLAVCTALREFTGLDCLIKWPNDIIAGNKKIAGILTEMSAEFDAVEYVIPGIGINVCQTSFPQEIAYKATSVLLETGRHFDQNELLACILHRLEDVFMQTNLNFTPSASDEYRKLCATIGRTVSFKRGTRRISGTAVSVSDKGELEVMLSDGNICLVNSGEVTVQGIY